MTLDERRTRLKRVAGFCAILGLTWTVLAVVHAAFPYIRPGAELVYEAKIEAAKSRFRFGPPEDRKARVIVFGDSKVLSGFDPALFDQLSERSAVSLNMGLPDAAQFLEELKSLIARGEIPTHVLLTVPWSPLPAPSLLDRLLDDSWIRKRVAPFYSLPRDLAIFALRARSRGGMRASYAKAAADVEKMLNARGYYFIEGQSHYPNHELPSDFKAASDQPAAVKERRVELDGPAFRELEALAAAHRFKVLLVPTYYRATEAAPPPPLHPRLADALRDKPFVGVRGPDYFLYENRLFSDIAHLNLPGSARYTRDLWTLIEPDLRQAR